LSRLRAHYLLAIAAGAALPLAFAPFGQFWLAPLSYAVLLYVWCDAAPRQAAGLGFAFGCASFGLGTYWTYIAVGEIGEAPVALALFLTVGLTAVLAAFVALAGWAAAGWFRTRGALAWLATLPALFVLTEWLRGWLFSGFGWLAAGYSQTDSWLMAYAPLAGIHAISAGVLVSAGGLVAFALGTNRERGIAAAVVAAIWFGGLAARGRELTQPKETALEVALATGAVAQTLKWEPEQLQPTVALYTELTNQSAGADLVIWPEAAIPMPVEYIGPYLETMRRRAAERGSTLLLGVLRTVSDGEGNETYENVLLAMTDEPQVYVKRHLVPFGEYFPVPAFVRNWMRLMSLPNSDFAAGSDSQAPLAVAGQTLAPTICYEDAYGVEQLSLARNSTLLVNVSNDAWFGDSTAPHQHLDISRMRALEAGRPMLRATNDGVTALIEHDGRILATLPQFQPGVLTGSLQPRTGLTPYLRVGNVPVLALIALGLVAGFAVPRRWLARRPRSHEASA
jgi:apolipoprotein N-acyltransferase